MKIQITEALTSEIQELVESGVYVSIETAVEDLVHSALRRRSSKTAGRFAYSEPSFTPDELSLEIWHPFPIEGFSMYRVSSLGRVRSLHSGYAKPIKLSPQTNGYRQAPVMADDGRKRFPLVQRLVAGAFLPAVSGRSEVNHINGNKADNRITNLEWLSPAENSRHAVETGLRHWRGVHHRAKVTEEGVRFIRSSSPLNAKSLSEKYGISYTQIRRIQDGKAWVHVK